MQQSVKVKLHWGSPSLSLTTGLQTKCTQSEGDKTAPVAHRYAPLPLSWNALCFYSVWTTRGWVYAVNLTFDLVSCAHVWMWLWTVLCFWHTHFWIFYDKQSKPLVAVCVCGGVSLFWCHTALKWSDNSITHVGLEWTNIWIKPYEVHPLCHQCCDS